MQFLHFPFALRVVSRVGCDAKTKKGSMYYSVSTFHVLAKTFLKTVRFEVSPQVLKSETQHEALLLVLLFCSITLTASAYTVYVAIPMMPAMSAVFLATTLATERAITSHVTSQQS